MAGGLLVGNRQLAPAESLGASPQTFVLEGHADYYQGRPEEAIEAYRRALRKDARLVEAWVNGAVVLSELGRPGESLSWMVRAAALRPGDIRIRTALGELFMRRGKFRDAERELEAVLDQEPGHAHAWLALGQTQLALGRPEEAVPALESAAEHAPHLSLAHFWLGRAYDALGRPERAVESYEKASQGDSYFTRSRYRLAQALARIGNISDAAAETVKLVDAAPANRTFRKLESALRLRLRNGGPRSAPKRRSKFRTAAAAEPPQKVARRRVQPPGDRVPELRVGIGTTNMGRPRAWRGVRVTASSAFTLRRAKDGSYVAKGGAGRWWKVGLGVRGSLEVRDEKGGLLARTDGGLRIVPRPRGSTWLREERGGRTRLERRLRGTVELSPQGKGIRVVNVIDLERYTHGVVSAEMPVRSPLEALKSQAVIARTHALFIKNVRKRHKRDGYDLCDGQHCQVYRGVSAESRRSRAVVEGTRGRVITFKGRVANVLYSSNCGGHSQSAADVKGWGSVPYFKGVPDAAEAETPHSPWQLRNWLREPQKSYCSLSSFVHPAHARWTRVIPAYELGKRLDRHLHIGELEAIIPLKRSRSGHLNSVLVRGSLGTRLIESEMKIRGLFGVGSQRSALFVMDPYWDASGRPTHFVFYGGGWGHGVGLCQSGAIGRAERGQSYEHILQAYYTGVEIGNLRY